VRRIETALTRNWLSAYNSPPLPGAEAMQDDYRVFQVDIGGAVDALRSHRLRHDKLEHPDFLWAVRDWIATRAH
jgi:hypothetical protein